MHWQHPGRAGTDRHGRLDDTPSTCMITETAADGVLFCPNVENFNLGFAVCQFVALVFPGFKANSFLCS